MVTVTLARGAHEYLSRLLELGALEGSPGKTDISPSLKPVIQVMHHVLAGGKARITITQKGDPTTVRKLDSLLKRGNREADRLSRKKNLAQPPMLRV